jgi:hypothetical protein
LRSATEAPVRNVYHPDVFRQRRDAWVFLKGRTPTSALGARVELVEARKRRRAGPDGGSGEPYTWAVFPETPHGDYTVRVTYPSGVRQTAQLTVNETTHAVTLEEPAVD